MKLESRVPNNESKLARLAGLCLFALATLCSTASSLQAQPFGGWGIYSRPPQGFLEVPHSQALNPTGEITIEGWVNVRDPGACSTIIGKGFQSAWWVGICGTSLRSYLRGAGSGRTGGELAGGWNHFAVTYDGVRRLHYINGELANSWLEGDSLTTNSQPVRIGSDVDFEGFTVEGTINEIRLWDVPRSTLQLRETINESISSPRPGLVASWSGFGTDLVGPHDASVVGSVPGLTFPVTSDPCTTTATSLCLHDRFVISGNWRTGSDSGQAMVAPITTVQSGIFWFFNPTNWEVMVKVLNGCASTNHWWLFSAATTNVFYRLEVFDQLDGVNKVYFNYPGPPAPAVTDTMALATCP
ncbi:MAG: LamG domain-containing protein [Deltaproteobacteria bacterium]|nr:LamG domain-containing protein [Deltaproteobacteria bacterium]